MNIAIVGSRDFDETEVIRETLDDLRRSHHELTVVSGGARGADSIGERVAKELGIATIVHLPDWNRYGKSAGFRRNDLIVRDADIVYAFFAKGERSRGTSHTVAQAKIAGKAVYIYHEGIWS